MVLGIANSFAEIYLDGADPRVYARYHVALTSGKVRIMKISIEYCVQ